jgi:micrococcal nuclease
MMINRKNILICLLVVLFFLPSCSLLRNNGAGFFKKPNTELKTFFIVTPELPIYQKFTCIPSPENPEIGFITEVIDGDSIKARIDGKVYEIRYIGMNTPEYYSNEKAAAELATLENKKLVEGEKVYLFKDMSNTDKYRRLLRYVFTDEYFVNYELVKRGFAESKSYYPDISCQIIFNQAVQ